MTIEYKLKAQPGQEYMSLRRYPTDCTFVFTKWQNGRVVSEIELGIESQAWILVDSIISDAERRLGNVLAGVRKGSIES